MEYKKWWCVVEKVRQSRQCAIVATSYFVTRFLRQDTANQITVSCRSDPNNWSGRRPSARKLQISTLRARRTYLRRPTYLPGSGSSLQSRALRATFEGYGCVCVDVILALPFTKYSSVWVLVSRSCSAEERCRLSIFWVHVSNMTPVRISSIHASLG